MCSVVTANEGERERECVKGEGGGYVSRTLGEYLSGDSSEFPIPQFSLVSLCVCVCVCVCAPVKRGQN
jgi:hypothetical protein